MARAALVTGAGKRIGRALALTLADAGYDVAVHYNRSKSDAEDVAAQIIKRGRKSCCIQADLSQETQTETLLERACEQLDRRLCVLINNASVFENDDVETMTRQSWDRHMETNLRAPVKLAQSFADQILPDGDNLIVNIIDQRVLKLTPQFLSYTASKAALYAMTITLAQALGPKSVRVNAIGPGPTLKNPRQSDEDWARQNSATVLGHGAGPDDISAALRYFLTAKAVTGQMIAVDGGQHLAWQTPDVMIKE